MTEERGMEMSYETIMMSCAPSSASSTTLVHFSMWTTPLPPAPPSVRVSRSAVDIHFSSLSGMDGGGGGGGEGLRQSYID